MTLEVLLITRRVEPCRISLLIRFFVAFWGASLFDACWSGISESDASGEGVFMHSKTLILFGLKYSVIVSSDPLPLGEGRPADAQRDDPQRTVWIGPHVPQ